MDLLKMATDVLGSVAPTVVSLLAGPQAGAIVGSLSNALLGHSNGTPDEVAQALKTATPDQIAEIKKIESAERVRLAEIEKDDRIDARELQLAALNSDDTLVRRFIYLFSWFWAIASVLYFFAVTFLPMPVGGKDFALTILGFLLGTAVGTILSFWYGKSSE